MGNQVHILATVRKAELLPAALLVFRTLRVGFPTAAVVVWGNGLSGEAREAVSRAAESVEATYFDVPLMAHDRWIEELLARATEPFWICDTDVVFWRSVEGFGMQPEHGQSEVLCAGRFEPEFEDEVTRTTHVERLQTSLMWFNAGPLRVAMRAEMARAVEPWRNTAEYPFVRQTFLSLNGRRLLYDTCTGIWQAGLGTRFTEEKNGAFEHLHCATYMDQTAGRMSGGAAMAARHAAIYENPEAARGLWQAQQEYYRMRSREN